MQPQKAGRSPTPKAAEAWMESPRENILGYVDMFPTGSKQSPVHLLESFDQNAGQTTYLHNSGADESAALAMDSKYRWEAPQRMPSFLINSTYELESGLPLDQPLQLPTDGDQELTQWKECAHQAIEQLERAKRDAMDWELLARETEAKLKECEKERNRMIDDMSNLVSDYEMLAAKVGQTPEQLLKEEQGENARLHRFIHHIQSELKITTKRLYHARYEVSRLEMENRYLRSQLQQSSEIHINAPQNLKGFESPPKPVGFPEIQSLKENVEKLFGTMNRVRRSQRELFVENQNLTSALQAYERQELVSPRGPQPTSDLQWSDGPIKVPTPSGVIQVLDLDEDGYRSLSSDLDNQLVNMQETVLNWIGSDASVTVNRGDIDVFLGIVEQYVIHAASEHRQLRIITQSLRRILKAPLY